MVTVSVTATFHNPSLSRRKEWQQGTRLYRDTTQLCTDGWENGDFGKSVTTASIDNDLYSALQNQAIREAKSDHNRDGGARHRESQPFAVNNQNWEIDTTENGTVVAGFPCISQWWYTPIEVYDDIADPVDRLVEGDARKTRPHVYRRGDDWYGTFNAEYDADTSGETPIGVDIGERHILAVTADGEAESVLVSGGEGKYARRRYRSLRESLPEAGALRARNRVGDKEQRRIKRLNHKPSRRLITFAEQFENPVIRTEVEGVRENSSWSGVHSWHFHQLQQFITYEAERAGIRVEKVDAYHTGQRCSECGSMGTRDGDHLSCSECNRGRHADLNASENIARREDEHARANASGESNRATSLVE
jgi:IS605 OrfB family transposase